jgi:PAS domain S-box-containing protein
VVLNISFLRIIWRQAGEQQAIRSRAKRMHRARYLKIYLLAGLLFVFGLCACLYEIAVGRTAEFSNNLLQKALAIAEALPPDDLELLSEPADDAARLRRARISRFVDSYADFSGIDRIHVLAVDDAGLLLPDAEGLPPCGTLSYDSSGGLQIVRERASMATGFCTDARTCRISAFAPILDPKDGTVLAVLAVHEHVSRRRAFVYRSGRIPLLILLGLFVLTAIALCFNLRRAAGSAAPTKGCLFVTAAFMLMATIGVSILSDREHSADIRRDFDALTRLEARLRVEAMREIGRDLRQIAVFFESSEFVTRAEFRSLLLPLLEGHPVLACAWVPAVPAAERESFEAAVRAEGLVDFRLRPLPDADGAARGDVLWPALYVESLSGEEDALGYELSSEPIRRAAIAETLRSGRMTASDPLSLAGLPGGPTGFFIFCPVDSARQRGLLALVVRPSMLMENLARSLVAQDGGLAISLYQLGADGGAELLYAPPEESHGTARRAALEQTIPIFEFGRSYVLHVVPGAVWMRAHPRIRGVIALVAGLALSAALISLLAVLLDRPRRLEALVEQSESKLSTLLANLPGTAFRCDYDPGWKMDFLSEGCYELTGYHPGELIDNAGISYADIIHPDDRAAVWKIIQAAVQGMIHYEIEYRIVTRAGETKWVWERGMAQYSDDGEVLCLDGFINDITERKVMEDELRRRLVELERFNQASVGRELRMIDLKRQINALSRELGRAEPYSLENLDSRSGEAC